MTAASLFTLFISGVLVNNIILARFIGMCPFMGVSTKLSSAIGMGLAVIFVIFGASVLSWLLYYYVLVPLDITYMKLICFILLIASFVQFVEMFIKKQSPSLYNISQEYNLIQTMVNSIAVPLGFMLVLVLFATIRERLAGNDIPRAFKGNPIAFVVAAILAVAFSAFAGIA